MRNTVVNSVIFHTQNLQLNKEFYQRLFDFKVGSYEKNGKTMADESEKYVNFHTDSLLLCFEEGPTTDKGALVLHVEDLKLFNEVLKVSKIEIQKQTEAWVKIKDPDGRTLIVEQNAEGLKHEGSA